jgi:predicted dehydrogenase
VNPLKFGILSTAEISVQALILPGRNHPEVEFYSIAGRSKEKVERFARKHGIEKIFSGPDGYQSNLFLTVCRVERGG